MMEKYKALKVNHELSKEVYKRNIQYIEVKCCYNNVFYIVTEDKESQREARIGNWNIAIGYYSDGTAHYYTRHAFIVDNNAQEVIDPTLAIQDDFNERDVHYYPIVSLSLRDYLLMAQSNEWYTDLTAVLTKEEGELREWLHSQGYRCLGLNPEEDYKELGIDETFVKLFGQ